MSSERKRHVIPGEVITSGPFRAEQNTVQVGENIVSTIVGLSDVHDGSVRVIPLTGGYVPKDDDLVIGKIVSHSSLSWTADINSCYVGMLPASDVFGRDYSSSSDDMTAKLAKGDLIAARIVNFDKTRDPLITISGRELGKIEGREVSTSSHYGTLDFVSGTFEISNGSIVNGQFIVDMTSINNQDMEGDSKARLEGHLKSDDFFSVESYPTAAISINSSELISDGKWNVLADLSIKGFTHPVNFEMISSEDGWSANLVFDRSKYDVRFRSGSFFENLGDKLIYDDIELSINLTTL